MQVQCLHVILIKNSNTQQHFVIFYLKKWKKNCYPRHSTLDRLARRGMIRRFSFVYLSRILYNRKETILKIEDELNELTHGHYEILILKKTFLSVWPF